MYSDFSISENNDDNKGKDITNYSETNIFSDSNDMMTNSGKSFSTNPSYIKLDIIVGIFLLILAISGNFLSETMGCQIQKLLSNNMFAKNIIIVMVIYFSLGFASDESNPHPLYVMKQTILIWLFFLLFNKMDVYYTIAVTFLLFAILICKDYKSYYNSQTGKEYKDKTIFLENLSNKLIIVTMLLTIIGFFIYFRKQRSDYSGSFSYAKFILGTPKCANL